MALIGLPCRDAYPCPHLRMSFPLWITESVRLKSPTRLGAFPQWRLPFRSTSPFSARPLVLVQITWTAKRRWFHHVGIGNALPVTRNRVAVPFKILWLFQSRVRSVIQ